MPRRCAAIIAKQPLPGKVKTRLAATIGSDAAARLCESFLRDTVQTLSQLSTSRRCLFFSPITAESWFSELDPEAILMSQPELPFGERLREGFSSLFAEGYDRVVFIGCDAPHISAQSVELAFEALNHDDLVLGPTDDGGYHLVGLRAPHPRVFDQVAWSSATVLSDTLRAAEREGLSTHLLPCSFDIDEAADLERLQRKLVDSPDNDCPLTTRTLSSL